MTPDASPADVDADLVRRAKQGDEAAFAGLVERHQGRVYQHASRLMGNAQDAEEVLQDTFLQVFRNLDRFEERSKFSTWVYRIATNEALMRLRRVGRRREVSLDDMPVAAVEHASEGVQALARTAVDHVMDREIREALQAAVAELPEEYRVVFVLRDVDDLTNAEVAEILDLSIAAVKSRLHRARLFLRDRIAGVVGTRGGGRQPKEEPSA